MKTGEIIGGSSNAWETTMVVGAVKDEEGNDMPVVRDVIILTDSMVAQSTANSAISAEA